MMACDVSTPAAVAQPSLLGGSAEVEVAADGSSVVNQALRMTGGGRLATLLPRQVPAASRSTVSFSREECSVYLSL